MPTTKQINKALDDAGKAIYRSWKHNVTSDIKELGAHYFKAYNEIDNILAEMDKKFVEGITKADMMKFNRLQKVHKQLDLMLKQLGVTTNKAMTSSVYTTFNETFYKKLYTYDSIAGQNITFGLLSKATIDASINKSLGLVKWSIHIKNINQKNIMALSTSVKASLSNGLIQGFGYGKTSRLIKANFSSSFYAVQRVVWTETARSRSIAALDAYNVIDGDDFNKFWISTLAKNTRPSHAKMDGVFAKPDGLFHLHDGSICETPGTTGVAKHDIHCKCDLGTAINEQMPALRRDQHSDETVNFENYPQWKKRIDKLDAYKRKNKD